MNVPQTIDDWTALVESREPFTYANIGGDGEMLTITGWDGVNSDGHRSTPEKAEALARCILEPRYTFAGYNPGKAGTKKLATAEAWLRKHGVNVPHRTASTLTDPDYGSAEINVHWVHKEIISAANTSGRLNGFLRAMLERNWLVLGGEHLEELCDVFPSADGWPAVATNDAGWEKLDGFEGFVRAALDRSDTDLITFSLGYLTKVLIWRLAPDYPDVTMIDLGACLDPYCGVLNRRKYKLPTWPEMMRRNLEGLV